MRSYRYTTGHRVLQRVVLLVCLLAAMPSCAQQWILAKKLDVANGGLPQNTCADIYFDKKSGFLWIATEGGLVRYDGKEQRIFDMHNVENIETPRMGRFFATTDGEVFSIAGPGTPVVIRKNQAIAIKGGIGPYWHALSCASCLSVNYLLKHKLHYPFGNDEAYLGRNFRKLTWLNENDYVLVYTDSIYYFKREHLTGKWPCSTDNSIVVVRRDDGAYIRKGIKWYFLDTGKCTLTTIKVSSLIEQPGSTPFYSAHEGQEPLLLNGTDVYEIKFKDHALVTRFFAHLPWLPGNIRTIHISPDRQQVYCATNLSGLYIYQVAKFRSYSIPAMDTLKSGFSTTDRNAANNCYAAILTDSNHILTHTGINYSLSDGSFKKVIFSSTITGEPTRKTMASLGSGWIMMSGPGIYNVRTGKSRIVRTAQYGVYCGFIGGSHWFANHDISVCRDDSLICIFPYNRFPDTIRNLLAIHGFSETSIAGFTYKGQLLIRYENFFMTIDTGRKTVLLKFRMNKAPGRLPVMDSKGLYCWIPTYGDGIYLYDVKEDRLYVAPMDAREYLAYSHTLAQDGHGNLLITTNNGLFRIGEQALIDACKKGRKNLVYEFYNTENGLNCTEFNGGCVPAFNRLGNGDIVFPSQNGLERVMVGSFTPPERYPLYLESVTTKDTVYGYHDNMHFSRNERLLTWKVSFAQWSGLYTIGLAYRLDDQRSWTYVLTGRTIQLSDLSGGEHQLQIRNQYDLSGKQFQLVTTRFTIEKKFYELAIFWIVLLAGLVLLTIFITQLVTRELRRRNILLEEKVAEKTTEINAKNTELEDTLDDLRHSMNALRNNSSFQKKLLSLIGHDFMVPLQYISKVSNLLSQYKEQLSKTTREESIDEISSTATSLMYLGQNIIQWIRLQEGSFTLKHEYFRVDEAIEKILQLHYQLASAKQNKLSVLLEGESLLHYDPVAIRIVVHNLLINANKFTVSGVISLRIYNSGDELVIEVADTGTGMDATTVSSLNSMQTVTSSSGTDNEAGWGLGYRLIIDLLEVSNGRLTISSEKGKGTTVTIVIPDAI